MTKTFCDRCKKECVPDITITYNFERFDTPEETHICRTCGADFKKWCIDYKDEKGNKS
jgi:RNase P subunit RPR2